MTMPAEKFIDVMGQMAQSEGAPPIAGRIFGYFIVSGEARTLAQMTEDLGISKASASTNARRLELRGALRRVPVPGSRQDAYELVDEPGLQSLTAMAQRFRAHAERMQGLADDFPPELEAARTRVERFAEFHRKSADFIDEWTERLTAETVTPETEAGEPE